LNIIGGYKIIKDNYKNLLRLIYIMVIDIL